VFNRHCDVDHRLRRDVEALTPEKKTPNDAEADDAAVELGEVKIQDGRGQRKEEQEEKAAEAE
jgi:hypothetical protein